MTAPTHRARPRRLARTLLLAVAVLAALLISVIADWPVANFVRKSGLESWMNAHYLLEQILKSPGTYYFTLAIAALVARFHRRHGRAAIWIILSGIFPLLNLLMKWLVGRIRPWHIPRADGNPVLAPLLFYPLKNGLDGLLHEHDLCFASGHAAVAFSWAASLGIFYPRYRPLYFTIATIVGLERIAENAHYLSDVVAAVILSILSIAILHRCFAKKLLQA